VTDVVYDGSGGCYVTGSSTQRIIASSTPTSTGYQMFLVHLNSQGTMLGVAQSVGTGLTMDATGYPIYP
jgi:hypothetical protein